jgi:hypothetical protein
MQSANATINKSLGLFTFFIILNINSFSQDNSAYSRYGIGDLVNHSNILSRGMGGLNAGFGSKRFINPDNPASYSMLDPDFGIDLGQGNGKLISFELGTEFSSKTIQQQNPAGKFNTKNLIFNYMQLGMQVGKKNNWGFNLALLPIANVSYKIENFKRISNVDSAQTIYDGSGGTYKAMVGTGYRYKNLSFGINTGYLFGKKNISSNLHLINDSVQYYESSSNVKTNYGNIFFQTGILYDFKISKTKTLRFGANYELQNKLRASQDLEKLVYDNDNPNSPNSGVDSIFIKKDLKGEIIYPATMGFGFTYENSNSLLFGVDFVSTAWDKYRFYGQTDQVKNNWMVKTGLQWMPAKISKSYWSTVTYRTGFNYGNDYISVSGKNLPVYTLCFGIGLPVSNSAKLFKNNLQPVINLALEAGKRGNKDVNLRENFVKLALSVSLSDLWFFRRKFD